MTVIISLPHPKMIIMCADSLKTIYSTQINNASELTAEEAREEYSSIQKMFFAPSVGCVTWWGDLTRAEFPHFNFPSYLEDNLTRINNVEELKTFVEQYLRKDLEPHLYGEDIGFHIAGFAPDGLPKLYHVFWGRNRPPKENEEPDYHSYPSETLLALYNGRNDFVHPIMDLLVSLQNEVGVTIFNEDAIQRIILVDFITRYISQFSSDVGGDINTVLISPDNKMLHICNQSGLPVLPSMLGGIINKWQGTLDNLVSFSLSIAIS